MSQPPTPPGRPAKPPATQPARQPAAKAAGKPAKRPPKPGRRGTQPAGQPEWVDETLGRFKGFRENPVRWVLALVVVAVGVVAAGWLGAVGSNLAPGGDDAGPSAARPETPFSVAAATDVGEGGDWALPRPARDTADAAGLLDGSFDGVGLPEYVQRRGGAGVGTVYCNVVLTGPSDAAMRVTRVAVHRYPTRPVLTGTVVRTPAAGDVGAIPLSIDLDKPGEELTGADGTPHFRTRAVELGPGEHATLAVTVTGTRAHYRWALRIDYVDAGGRAKTVLAGRDGTLYPRPQDVPADNYFALTGPAPRYGVEYESLFPAQGYAPVVE
jgi:hypothetical protein